ncbi:TPA: hypothetical protein ACM7E1_005086, partial [Escherichia coli]
QYPLRCLLQHFPDFRDSLLTPSDSEEREFMLCSGCHFSKREMIIMKSLCMIEHKIQTPLQYGVFLACDD